MRSVNFSLPSFPAHHGANFRALPDAETSDGGIEPEELPSAESLQTLSPVVRAWYGDEELLRNVREWLDPDITLLTDETLALQISQRIPVAGVTASAYRNVLLRASSGIVLLCGSRFRELRPDRPFAEVIYHSRPFRSAEEVAEALELCLRAYAAFWVYSVCMYHHETVLPWDIPGFVAEPHKQYRAALIDAIRRQDPPDASKNVELIRSPDLRWYYDYVREYQTFFSQSPSGREWSRIESREQLEAYREAGHLFEIRIGGQWAGVVAVERSTAHGIRGYHVAELLLAAAFRRKGYAAAIQWLLCRQLPATGNDALFGTIHSANRASLGSARRIGRVPVGGYHMFMPSHPGSR